MEVIGIRDAQGMGLSKVLKLADEEGFVLLTSNRLPRAMVIPLSMSGLIKYANVSRELLGTIQLKDLNEADAEVVNLIDDVLKKSLAQMQTRTSLF